MNNQEVNAIEIDVLFLLKQFGERNFNSLNCSVDCGVGICLQ